MHTSTLSDSNVKKKIPIKNSEIKWEKVKTNIRASDKTDLQWDVLEINELNSVNKKYNLKYQIITIIPLQKLEVSIAQLFLKINL